MLVLSRKPSESLYVGDAEVIVIEIKPGRVRIGVKAPLSTPVHRGELHDLIVNEDESIPTLWGHV